MSRVSQRGLVGVRTSLSERDSAIIDDLDRVRLLTARQVERLHFSEGSALTQARRARRTLERLTRDDVLHRFQRQIGGVRAGSAGYVYGLSGLGQRLAEGAGPAGGDRNRRPWEPSGQFMQHVLAVSELYVALRQAETEKHLDLLTFDAEPASWRWDTNSRGTSVKPDAFISVGVGRYEELRFVEVDLATESRTIITRKAKAYVDYWQSGAEQQASGAFPSVLFMAETAERVDALVRVLSGLPADTGQLFQVGLLANVVGLIRGSDEAQAPGRSLSKNERREL
jgi:Replication-relaxation